MLAALASVAVAVAVMVAPAEHRVVEGKPDLKSAGPLTFGPDGILFVGDTKGAASSPSTPATGPRRPRSGRSRSRTSPARSRRCWAPTPDNVQINDLAVNPRSGNAYLSVARGRGPDAIAGDRPDQRRRQARGAVARQRPVRQGRRSPTPPPPGASSAGQELRNESITDLAYVDGRVFLAGLSNEEFSSRLIAIPFPFSSDGVDGAAIEIYHGAHGQFETKSPIRTFVAYQIKSEPYLLAAYTCTPLVKVPVAELKAGAHVKGTTIAELGNRNRPLDMIVYQKDGKDYLLMTNNSRGVMKITHRGRRLGREHHRSPSAAAAPRAWATTRSTASRASSSSISSTMATP